jgi:hypothetical protein
MNHFSLCGLVRSTNRAAKLYLFAGSLLGLASCGGGLNEATPAVPTLGEGPIQSLPAPTGTESGAPTKIISVPGGTGALVALFPDGHALYSPDGFNVAGGGSTVFAYNGASTVIDMVAVGAGIDVLLADGSAYFSPNGLNLGGGGLTVPAYGGALKISGLTQVGSGVDAIFAGAGGGVYYSPDGRNLGGGGATVNIYGGKSGVLQIVPVGASGGVVSLFEDGSVYFSPNNRDIGGGGTTMTAAPAGHSPIKQLVKVGGGVLTEFTGGQVYLSPDGLNLAGGGATIDVANWNTSPANGPYGERDSAHGTEFAGHLWISGGYNDPTNTASCFSTCSYFDLWASTDLTGTSWNSKPSFATATSPNPRDASPVVNDGVQDVAVPTDFYDSYSPIVVWNSRLFAIGNTVWSSADGVSWARQNLADGVTAAPGPLPTRASENSRAVVLGTTLFFLQPDSGEVYSTTDPNAAVWSDLGAIPGFAPRCGGAVFVLLGKLWIEGGGACDYSQVYNDIWSSADGINWTQSGTAAAWPARMWPCIAPADNGIIWLVAGYAPTDWSDVDGSVTVRYSENHSDVWYSKDGATWRQFKADYGSGLPDGNTFEPRHAATCYVTQGGSANTRSLVVTAGSAGANPNAGADHVSNTVRTLSLPAATALP